MQRRWAMNAPLAAAVHETLALTRVCRALEADRRDAIARELRDCERLLAAQPEKRRTDPMGQKPSDQLAALVKSAESGALRGVVSRALGSLAAGNGAFGSLKSTLAEYETAVLNAGKLDEFLRGELQAAGDNGAPAGTELGNSSASSQASSGQPAPAADPADPADTAAPAAQDGSPAPGTPLPGVHAPTPPAASAPVAGPGLPHRMGFTTLTSRG